jgi:hypothetical protein
VSPGEIVPDIPVAALPIVGRSKIPDVPIVVDTSVPGDLRIVVEISV